MEGLELPEEMEKEIVSNIRRRLTPQAMRIRADVEVTCFGYEGIDAIKQALLAGEACKTETADIKIKLVAPPLYVLLTQCMDKQHGIEALEKSIAKIEEVIKKLDGTLVVKMKVPRLLIRFGLLTIDRLASRSLRIRRSRTGCTYGAC
jgi:translation initiation factor 2 subunit 1